MIGKICNALGILILLAVILAAGSVTGAKLLGYQPMGILSGSMEPAYNVGGLVFIDTNARAEDIEVGEAIAYNLQEDMVVTHRVIAIDEGGRSFTTKGDANNAEDLAPVPFENLIGKAVFHVPRAGYVLMNLSTPKGFAAGAILIAVLIILFVIPVLLAPAKKQESISKTQEEQTQEERKVKP
ncbi:MAG: signal peptidase I [Clostridiales Family XIII bacterium]|nr:signal peptidase I [Clostridiales Family XIII bacterium]